MSPAEPFPTANLLRQFRDWGLEAVPHVPLAPHLTLGIGGTAEVLVKVPFRPQLNLLWQTVREEGIPTVLLGGGSNVAFVDGPIHAVVVVNQTRELEMTDPQLWTVDSGFRWPEFFAASLRAGMGGLEFLAGLPGTLGGAAAVNAGAFGQQFGDFLQGAEIVDENGHLRQVDSDYFRFTYRHSKLKFASQAILRLFIRVQPRNPEEIREELRRNVLHRQQHHPLLTTARSAGCFFQNPLDRGVKVSAGKLIEECGLKGSSCGDVEVSPMHANFLVNRGHATFADLQRLAGRIFHQVCGRSGLHLQREVIFIDSGGVKY